MKTLEEIDEILYEACKGDLFVEITLMPGLGVRYNKEMKIVTITYPKLELGMPQHGLMGRIVETGEEVDWGGSLEGDERIDFETEKGYNFLLKHSEIEDCKVLPDILYYWLYE